MLTVNSNYITNSSDIEKEWSRNVDQALTERPVFIKRDNQFFLLCSTSLIKQMVKNLPIIVDQYTEDDGSITLTPVEMDLVDSGETLELAKKALVDDLIEYADIYMEEFEQFSQAPNRKDHLPFVMKVLIADSRKEIEDALLCRPGKN